MNDFSNFIAETDDYSEDYGHLSGGVWDGVKQVASGVWGAFSNLVAPVAPQLIYKQATGQELPPQTVYVPAEQPKPALPAWLIPAGIGLLAVILLKKRNV